MTENDDLRAFIRDITARFDRGMEAVLAGQEIAREENRRYFERIEVETKQIRADGEAGRNALFRILDRLDGGGGGAPA